MCGCKKCSHGARAKPKPRPKPPRVGPRPKAGAKKKGGRRKYEGSGMGGMGRLWDFRAIGARKTKFNFVNIRRDVVLK
jgi:hypothetical protein